MNYKSNFLTTIIFFVTISFCFSSCNNKQKENIVSKEEALEIAKKYNISGDNVDIYFKTYIYPKNSLGFKKGKRKLLFWNVSKKCNHCGFIQIDAETGDVFTIGKYNYKY